METAIDDLLHKVRSDCRNPQGELLRQLVDLIYERRRQRNMTWSR